MAASSAHQQVQRAVSHTARRPPVPCALHTKQPTKKSAQQAARSAKATRPTKGAHRHSQGARPAKAAHRQSAQPTRGTCRQGTQRRTSEKRYAHRTPTKHPQRRPHIYIPSPWQPLAAGILRSPRQCTALVLLIFISILLITLLLGPFPTATRTSHHSSEQQSYTDYADQSGSSTHEKGQGSAFISTSTSHTSSSRKKPESHKPTAEKPGTVVISDELTLDYATPDSLTVLINKNHPTPENFTPHNIVPLDKFGVPVVGTNYSLRNDAAQALADMYADASAHGSPFALISGYRSIETQRQIFADNTKISGTNAETYSARPRYSEHHTGLAADLADTALQCTLIDCFADTSAGKWLAEHSWKYGYILRYPKDGEKITGYTYEPWHFRYIGKEAAAAYHTRGAHTYEEFLEVEPMPHYEDE